MAARPPHDCLPSNSSANQHGGACPGEGAKGGARPPRGRGREGMGHGRQIGPRATFAETPGPPAFLGRAPECRDAAFCLCFAPSGENRPVFHADGTDFGPAESFCFAVGHVAAWAGGGGRCSVGSLVLSLCFATRKGRMEGGRELPRSSSEEFQAVVSNVVGRWRTSLVILLDMGNRHCWTMDVHFHSSKDGFP